MLCISKIGHYRGTKNIFIYITFILYRHIRTDVPLYNLEHVKNVLLYYKILMFIGIRQS